jgi:beta-glucosidase
MFEAIRWARKFDKPILITENGIDDAEDTLRPRYIIEHLHQVWRAVNFQLSRQGLLPLDPGR